jgi:hypothetical protein
MLLRWTRLIGLPDNSVRAARTLPRGASPVPLTAAPTVEHFTYRLAGPGRATSSQDAPGPESSPPSDRLDSGRLSTKVVSSGLGTSSAQRAAVRAA